MALYHIKTTGTRSSGVSVADDWSDANCYASPLSISEVAGDVILFDTGIYLLASQWTISAGITVDTRQTGIVILDTAGSVTNLIQSSAGSGETLTINNVSLRGVNVTSAALNLKDEAHSYTTILNDVKLLGSTGNYGILASQREGAITINNLGVSGNYANHIIDSSSSLAQNDDLTLSIHGIDFNATLSLAGQRRALRFQKGDFSNDLFATITGVRGTVTHTGTADGDAIVGIELANATNPEIYGNELTCVAPAVTASGYGLWVHGDSGTNEICTNPHIHHNEFNNLQRAGDALGVGQDSDSGNGKVTGARVHDNVLFGIYDATGTPHGLTARGLADGDFYGNKMSNFHSPMMLSLCTNDAVEMHNNLILQSYGLGLSFKGNSGGVMHNNTVVVDSRSEAAASSGPHGIWARAQGGTDNTGGKAHNNDILIIGATGSNMFTRVDTSSTCEFMNNNYYSDDTIAADAWNFTASDYATMALWQASGRDVDGSNVNSARDLTTGELTADSPDMANGRRWWVSTGPRPHGWGGDAMPDFGIIIGHKQTDFAPFHPTNL